jgi:hypothetical protein
MSSGTLVALIASTRNLQPTYAYLVSRLPSVKLQIQALSGELLTTTSVKRYRAYTSFWSFRIRIWTVPELCVQI